MFQSVCFGTAVLLIVSVGSVYSVRCNEGVNATVLGIPLYYWSERDCVPNSQCFMQELVVKRYERLTFRYGGCISAAYAPTFTCEKLFGPESTMDPSGLLDIMAGADEMLDNMAQQYYENAYPHVKLLFSKGKGMEEFVEGIFTFFEILDFNMKEARKLKQPLAKVMGLIVAPESQSTFEEWPNQFNTSLTELLDAIENLNKKDPKTTAEIYKFLENVIRSPTKLADIKASRLRVVIENIPGLLKSMLLNSDARHWMDAIFEMLGSVDLTMPQKSAEEVRNILKSSMNMSEELVKFFETLPYLMTDLLSGKPFVHAIPAWGVSVLKAYSVKNNATIALSNSIVDFMKAFNSSIAEISELITWFPGFFYRFFPAKKAEIDAAFGQISEGLRSFNFGNIGESKHLEHTKMSEFLLSLVRSVKPEMEPLDTALIINLSKMFYNAMTDKYEEKVDTFFSTLISGFRTFPKIDSGVIIINITQNLGGKVPVGVNPMLLSLQSIVDALISQNPEIFQRALTDMVNRYKTAFPESGFAKIADQYLLMFDVAKKMSEYTPNCLEHIDWENGGFAHVESNSKFEKCMKDSRQKIRKDTWKIIQIKNSADVDLFFAVFKATGSDSDEYVKNLDPGLAAYVQLFRALDPDDVKELMNDYSRWINNIFQDPDNYDFDNFLFAINASMSKITSKLGNVIKDLRNVHAPESCKYFTCPKSLCNTHIALDRTKIVRTGTSDEGTNKETLSTTTTPTGGDGGIVPTFTLCIAALLVSWKTASV